MAKRCEILSLDPGSPGQETIARAAGVVKRGGLVVFPTSSFYGIGADVFNPRAVEEVFRVKRRDPLKPILILIASMADLTPLVRTIPDPASRLMEAFWPGGITLVFDASDRLPPNLTGFTGRIGIRLADHPVAGRLVEAAGRPITGTSANISGTGGCDELAQLDVSILERVDLVLDAGRLRGGKGSTVVDVTADPARIIREGAIDSDRIREVLGRN